MKRLLRSSLTASFALLVIAGASACGGGNGDRARSDAGFVCTEEGQETCIENVHVVCERRGDFFTQVRDDCSETDEVCAEGLGCVTCRPDETGCEGGDVAECRADGSGWDVTEDCDENEGFACSEGSCATLCEITQAERSYMGCEFYAVDLDNAAIAADSDASSQQYAIVVSNPSPTSAEVIVEANAAMPGVDAKPFEVARATILPGDLEIFELPRREVDGSSSNAVCTVKERECAGEEVCVCSRDDTEDPCYCRRSAASDGRNDGTHTAVTSNAYRVRSNLPIIAYQFNPLDNVGVFSNDASLLLPTSGIGETYTIVGWPQTIADAQCAPDDTECRLRDFDSNRSDEDLRATLTIVGTRPQTRVRIALGDQVVRVVRGGPIAESFPGSMLELDIGPFDVINLETQGLNADFTGSSLTATAPIAVFVGSEASDAPRFDTYLERQCCADHLEEQLFPDATLGASFVIARMPPRTHALKEAFIDSTTVAEVNEPEYVRVVGVAARDTQLRTTLPPPNDRFTLRQHESVILEAEQDFMMFADVPVAVMQVSPSQAVTGIPSDYPGGDPAMTAVPPIEQYRDNYVFLTPDKYAFDFVIITAPYGAQVELDGAPPDPERCTTAPADGIERDEQDPPPDYIIYRCQLSFPDVTGPPNITVYPGDQDDGVHRLIASEPVGLLVYGFDAFVSYGYVGGLDLEPEPI